MVIDYPEQKLWFQNKPIFKIIDYVINYLL